LYCNVPDRLQQFFETARNPKPTQSKPPENHPSRLGKVQPKQSSLVGHRQQIIAISQIRESTVGHGPQVRRFDPQRFAVGLNSTLVIAFFRVRPTATVVCIGIIGRQPQRLVEVSNRLTKIAREEPG
jgi:hypothetical protein